MTRIKSERAVHTSGMRLLALLLVVVLSMGFAFDAPPAFAAESNNEAVPRYTNPDTGYAVVIIDDRQLLDNEEEELLVEDMKPITAYGNVAFWSTDERASNEIEQARQKRYSLFEYSSATIFVINMRIRKLTIQSYGELYKSINDSRARSITDNVSSFATSRRYYKAAKECYSQIYDVAEGLDIPEPMKFMGYAIFAIIMGFTITLIVAFSAKHNPLRSVSEEITGMHGDGILSEEGKKVIVSEEKVSASSGGGGGGGCGGGGGGCGGGGSSSF